MSELEKDLMDAWKLAEIHGAWYSLLLKLDVLTATHNELTPAQEFLSNGLEELEAVLAELHRGGAQP